MLNFSEDEAVEVARLTAEMEDGEEDPEAIAELDVEEIAGALPNSERKEL